MRVCLRSPLAPRQTKFAPFLGLRSEHDKTGDIAEAALIANAMRPSPFPARRAIKRGAIRESTGYALTQRYLA